MTKTELEKKLLGRRVRVEANIINAWVGFTGDIFVQLDNGLSAPLELVSFIGTERNLKHDRMTARERIEMLQDEFTCKVPMDDDDFNWLCSSLSLALDALDIISKIRNSTSGCNAVASDALAKINQEGGK